MVVDLKVQMEHGNKIDFGPPVAAFGLKRKSMFYTMHQYIQNGVPRRKFLRWSTSTGIPKLNPFNAETNGDGEDNADGVDWSLFDPFHAIAYRDYYEYQSIRIEVFAFNKETKSYEYKYFIRPINKNTSEETGPAELQAKNPNADFKIVSILLEFL